jgi:hypothetical protein
MIADREDRRAATATADRLGDDDGIAAPAGEDADGLAGERQSVLRSEKRHGRD